jgi:uncharacterized protein (UPF0297 family)
MVERFQINNWSQKTKISEERKSRNKGVNNMQDISNTQYFKVEKEQQIHVDQVMEVVYGALKEKGYNPVNQIVGYIMSGDPTYITSHKNARTLIMKVERDELVEEILRQYIRSSSWE